MVSKQRNVLGRGLDALIPQVESESKSAGSIVMIPLEQISPNPHQPRQVINPDSLAELVASIETHGVLQPLVVTEATDGYQIIAGERRWRAARLANLEAVPALVKETTSQEMLELALVENIQRADLNPLEEANAYRQLIDEYGLTQEQVAERVGKSRAAVANTVRLLRLPSEVQDALATGVVSEGHARCLLSLPDAELQLQALAQIVDKHLNVRQSENLVRQILAEPKAPTVTEAPPPLSVQDRHVVDEFQRRLGTRVNLVRGKKGGRVVIHFYSDEELDSIYRAILDEES
jgi:ParB family transcriptional regulator, chromosome partitioning protein